jgi:hypothetical protein
VKNKMRSSWLIVIAAVALTLQVSSASAINLVSNGGFETGDFTGWTLAGNTGFTGVDNNAAAEGTFSAFLGPVGSDGTLSQALSLVVGKTYFLSFAFAADGGTTSDFSASLGGVTLLSLSNPPASPFHTIGFFVTATAASEMLTFAFRDDPGYLRLDAVSVVLPEPASTALLAIGLAALFIGLRRKV